MRNINDFINIKGNINDGVRAVLQDLDKTFTVTMIDIDDLEPSKDNFYNVDNIAELKETIKWFGVQQPLLITKNGDKYEILAGGRRYKSCKELVEEGMTERRLLPCRILPKMSETLKNIIIIITNNMRVKSQPETTEEAARLKILYQNYRKENSKFKGRTIEAVANDMGVSREQVQRHIRIDEKLIEPLKDEYKKEKINFTAAAQAAQLPEEQQKEVLAKYEQTGTLTTADIKKAKPVKTVKKEVRQTVETILTTTAPETDIMRRVRAAEWYKCSLERMISQCADEARRADDRGNEILRAAIADRVEYLGEQLLGVQKDLFNMTSNDMFRGD